MVKRTFEAFECDVCGNVGERYSLVFPDGQLAMDRCTDHDKDIKVMRNGPGTWTPKTQPKSQFKVTTPEEIEKLRKK